MYNFQKIALIFITSLLSCVPAVQRNTDKNSFYIVKGRTDTNEDNNIILISSASSVTFSFKGDKCNIYLEAADTYPHHNYVVLELDGSYEGRLKIENGAHSYPIKVNGNGLHKLSIYKATESANGEIIFSGTDANLVKTKEAPGKKIEFIGDSITCGMGDDTQEIPCGTGEWYDEHNAYLAYGPVTARMLNADFLLSSVSGIGMYRNWNDEHKKEAIMPDVYDKLYLKRGNDTPYNFNFNPDVICIALGTNDFSDGDGTKPRLPFNEEKYVSNYINFVAMLYSHYPDAQLVLLNSPMVSGKKNETFIKCLEKVKDHFKNSGHKPMAIFKFTSITPHGCQYHPDINDHKLMAGQLAPFLKSFLDEK